MKVRLTTVFTPIFFAVLITLHAISPLLAIKILSKGFATSAAAAAGPLLLNSLWSACLITTTSLLQELDLQDSIVAHSSLHKQRLSQQYKLFRLLSIVSVTVEYATNKLRVKQSSSILIAWSNGKTRLGQDDGEKNFKDYVKLIEKLWVES